MPDLDNSMAAVYDEIFLECFNCCMIDMSKKDAVVEYMVKDEFGCTFTVVYSDDEHSFVCGCNVLQGRIYRADIFS